AVLPQVLASYVAYGLYIFELTIRASAVVGLVGAGGIGRVIEAQRVFYRFDRILAIVIMIVILVFILDQISAAMRRRLV
ncbi:MAG: phosphonate ABC transporter, permease protein PhnE, partial [Acidimicrobiia bacterium]